MRLLGDWITNGTEHPFYVRKVLTVTKKITRAEAKVCGLGQFVFYVNGKKIEDHELDPGWTAYDKLIEYVRFDLTDAFKLGENVLGAEVGNGWFIKDDLGYTFGFPSFMPPNPNPYKAYGKALVFAMKLDIDYADGSHETICADDTFKTAKHPTLRSNVYGSEVYDASLVQEGWSEAGFDDIAWEQAQILAEEEEPTGQLMEQFQPAIKVIKDYPAEYMHHANGRAIYTFHQNISGMLSFRAKGKKGDTIRFYPAEKLGEDKDVDQVAKNWVTVDTVITYVVGKDDTWENFRQKFAYFAGMYMAVEMPETCQIDNMVGHAITSAWKEAGTFCCDDDRYNKIYDMIERTVEANMVSVHTDCPTIERFAWQETNHLMGAAIMFMKDGKKLWEKFLLDMRVGQHTEEDYFFDFAGNKFKPGQGLVPSQCPCYIPNVLPVPGMGSFYDIIPWGSALILGARWHYLFYGDQKVIEDNYAAGLKYLDHLKTKMTEEGFIRHGLGDWGNPDEQLARENVETAFLYADARTLAEFARVLGETEDQADLEKFAEEVKANYNDRLLAQGPDGRWAYFSLEEKNKTGAFVTTQTCEALPLYWGMVPEDKKGDVVDAFKETLKEKGSFAAGEIGLPYIIQTAREEGLNDVIAEFILKPDHPSYYAFVLDGMTTLGEYWEKNPRSHAHDMMGHIQEWFFNGIGGIQIKAPGFKKVSIQPYMPESVNHFVVTHDTPYGTIRVAGRRVNGTPEYEISVPDDIEIE
ncbi:family 78 glycoside hydrolase catalytic domain [Bilifractor sp. LCP19S3_H10]|uniref:family 78 glycoside hydrolase catalytic domain n=1 Tax=Bilifractor sp. LCP19S3_H10 TaxID=3438736 RepID=UPI003F91B90E